MQIGDGWFTAPIFSFDDPDVDEVLCVARLKHGEELNLRTPLVHTEPLLTNRPSNFVQVYTAPSFLTDDQLDQVAANHIFDKDRRPLLEAINAGVVTAVFVTKERC